MVIPSVKRRLHENGAKSKKMKTDESSKEVAKSSHITPTDTVGGGEILPVSGETPAPNAGAAKIPSAPAPVSVPKIKCDRCGEVFKLGEQVGHRETCPKNSFKKSGDLKCDDCGKKFRSGASVGSLVVHKRTCKGVMPPPSTPSGAAPHMCGSCGKAFGSPSDVKSHVFDCPGPGATLPGKTESKQDKIEDSQTPIEPVGKTSDTSNEDKSAEEGGKQKTHEKMSKIVIKRTPSRRTWRLESGGCPRSPMKDANVGKTAAGGNGKRRKRGPSPSENENASVSKSKKSRQSEVGGAAEPEKSAQRSRRRSSKEAAESKIGDIMRNMDKGDPQSARLRNTSNQYVNREGHQIPTLNDRPRPRREVWSLRQRQQQKQHELQSISRNPKSSVGHKKSSDPYPRRSSARSAGKKISSIIKDIMEKDEDGLKKVNKEEAVGLKIMPSRTSKEAADKKISNVVDSLTQNDELVPKPSKNAVEAKDDPTPRKMLKRAKAAFPREVSTSALIGRNVVPSLVNKELRNFKEEATNLKEPEAKGSMQKYKNPLHVPGKTSDNPSESKADESEDKQRTYEKMSKVAAIKKERDEKESTLIDKILEPRTPPASSLTKMMPAAAKRTVDGGGEGKQSHKKRQKKAAAWWDGCKYRCPRCPTEFSDSAAVRLHVECVHRDPTSSIENVAA